MKIFAYNDFILKNQGGEIYADDSHILFIKHTAETYFEDYILGSRCIHSETKGHYFFTSDSKKVLDFPFYNSVSEFFTNPRLFFSAKKTLKKSISDYDVFWLTWPHPISFLVLTMIGRKKPIVLFVRQNLEALIQVRYKGINRFIGKKFTQFLYGYARFFHRNALIVSVGDEMFHYFKPVFKNNSFISDSIVSEKQQLPPRNQIGEHPKLLFVGRLEPEKGLFDLITAVKTLNETMPITLSIVGEGGLGEELRDFVDQLNLKSQVKFEGYKAFGESLFELYRSHDIMMISSYSEGLPKIINEARAFAMPIVSTKVGGIVKELQENKTCLFVQPGRPEELSSAVLFLIQNPEVYKTLSKNLSHQFSSNSLEFWSENFYSKVQKYVVYNY